MHGKEPDKLRHLPGFETLTLTPFDRDAIAPTQMTPQESILNAYHARVHAAIAPHLPPQEAGSAGPGHPSHLRN